MAIKVYGNKIVFPDSTEQTTAPTQLDGYDKAEMDAQQKAQDDKIQANTDAIEVNADAIEVNADAIEVNADELKNKVPEAPTDGKPYARKNKGWHEVETGTGDVEEAPKDGKTYGRKNEAWSEVTSDSYTKAEVDAQQTAQDTEINKKANTTDVDAKNVTQDAEIAKKSDKTDTYTKAEVDAQQLVQDAEITANTTDIATNTADIAENKTNIQQNTTDIESLIDDVDSLTGSIIYKGSLNATVTPAPADAVVGDMYINEYNVAEPSTNYPVASGWTPVTEVKYDDKLIKTDAGWDKIESVVGVPSYTAGEIDDLLDDKADKGDSYLKAEADTLLNEKADKNTTYTKAESDAKNDAQDSAIQLNTETINSLPTPVDTYTKDEIDASQLAQDTEIAKKQNTGVSYTKTEADTLLDNKSNVGDSYTKVESDTLLDNKANVGDSYTKAETYSNVEVDTKLFEKADKATTYTKTEVDASQALQDTEIAKKANQATTYTKDEVDSLLESASGAIVGNYTNKHASGGVARDPLAGNLYLSNGMSFSTDYNAVTSIYISDTDGDGEVRDFDEVQVADKITLTSEDGSGEYTIVTISDVGGYRELVVSTDSATGTIANDTPVSIVLDVASSGETGGGIEEAPADGKQYARQDEAWTEVTGGGDYTPEDLVWEDKSSERELGDSKGDKVYTNNYDTPLLVTITTLTEGQNAYSTFVVDGNNFATLGHGNSEEKTYNTATFTIPAGSTYEVVKGLYGTNQLEYWNEAKMPVAVGTGKTVAFRGHLSSNQTFTSGEYTKLNLDTTSIDTDNALVDGKFKPSVAGWYQVNGMISQACTPNAIQLTANIYKNGSLYSYGAHVKSEEVLGMSVHDVIYLDGKDDYLELYGRGIGTGTCAFNSVPTVTYLSAVLVSGGGSGGDYTPEKMVWEDKLSEREFLTEYTNTNDVPLYLSVTAAFPQEPEDKARRFSLLVDGKTVADAGREFTVTLSAFPSSKSTLFFIIPAGSTYEVYSSDIPTKLYWQEARMPVAVGTGGSATLESLGIANHDKIEVSENGHSKFTKPVTIRNEGGEALRFERTGYDVMDLNLSEDGFRVRNVTKSTTPVLLLNDSLNTTHDMKVNGVTVGTGGGNVNTNTVLGKGALNKNALGNSNTVIGTDALYNNEGNGNIAIGYRAGNNMTNSSNNILIGDSVQASTLTTSNEVTIGNDSITKTRLKGDVQTTKKDKKLTIDANVGELGLKSRITTDASILELKAGSGGLPDVTISDTEINLGSDTVTTTRLKGSLFAQGVWNDTASVGETPNVCVGNDGKLFRSLTTTYTTEEVDKKLAVKDKLIEKLSARLDKLEKKLK